MSILSNVKIGSYGRYSSSNYGVNCMYCTDTKGNKFYFSYDTIVAFRHKGQLYVTENQWGPTTGKHLTWIDGGNKKERMPYDKFNEKYKELFESENE